MYNVLFSLQRKVKKRGKRHNRVHPGHFATQQGTPFYPAGMSAADWSTLVFTLPRRKMAWVHPTMATFFQNCTLILDKYPVVSENETLPPAISPAEITLRSRQRAPKYTSFRAKHTVRNRHRTCIQLRIDSSRSKHSMARGNQPTNQRLFFKGNGQRGYTHPFFRQKWGVIKCRLRLRP